MTDLPPTSHLEYTIRHVESGLYSSGGERVRWSDEGKTWSNVGHLKNHLRRHARTNGGGYNHQKRGCPDQQPRGCELVCLRVTVSHPANRHSSITIVEVEPGEIRLTLEDLYDALNASDAKKRPLASKVSG